MTLRRFLARLIWACVLPLVALSAWLAIDSLRNALSVADRHAQTVTKNSATSIDQLLIGRIGALNVLAQSPLIDDPAHWPEFYRLLQKNELTPGHFQAELSTLAPSGDTPNSLK